MSIQVTCECGTTFTIAESRLGATFRCHMCARKITPAANRATDGESGESLPESVEQSPISIRALDAAPVDDDAVGTGETTATEATVEIDGASSTTNETTAVARSNEFDESTPAPRALSLQLENYAPGGLLLTSLTGLMLAEIVVTAAAFAAWYGLIPTEELGRLLERLESARNVLFTATTLLFVSSLYRASANARALGAEGMLFTPGWCVIWFFVPIMSLFMPFLAVREIWKASGPTTRNWRENPSPPLLRLWWALWLASKLLWLWQFDYVLWWRASTLLGFQTWTWIVFMATVGSAVVSLMMVRQLFSLQELKFAELEE